MKWQEPSEKELSLFNRLIEFAVSKDYKGNTIVDEIRLEQFWLDNGGTRQTLVNTFVHLYPEWKNAKVNDNIIMSTKSPNTFIYKIAELDFVNNRIRFFKSKTREIFNEYWLITRYPYMKIVNKPKETPGSSGWYDLPY